MGKVVSLEDYKKRQQPHIEIDMSDVFLALVEANAELEEAVAKIDKDD
jgi:hypothetical protein